MFVKGSNLRHFLGAPSHAVTGDVRQGEVAECGLAALASLMEHYGVAVPLDRLRELAASTLFGTSLKTLRQIALSFGFEARALKFDDPAQLTAAIPCLVHLDFIHFAVVERIGRDYVWLSDPLRGATRLRVERFSRSFTGIALHLRPAPSLRRQSGAPLPSRRTLICTAPIAIASGLSLASGAALAVAAIAVGRQIDGGSAFAVVVATLALTVALSEIAVRVVSAAAAKSSQQAWSEVVDHVARQPTAAFVLRSPAQAAAQLGAPADLPATALMDAPLAAALLLPLLVGALIALPALGAVGTILLIMELGVTAMIVMRRGAPAPHIRGYPMPVRTPGASEFSGAEGWGLGRGAEVLFRRLAGSHAMMANDVVAAAERYAGLSGFRAGMTGVRLCAVLLLGDLLWRTGAATPGAVVAAGLLVMAAGQQVARIAAGLRTPGPTAALHRLSDRLAVPILRSAEAPPVGIALSLDKVGWRPAAMLDDVVSDVSLTIPDGGSLALVGPPRSGATTIARLAAGLIEPSAGIVRALPSIILDTHWPLGAGAVRNLLAQGGALDEAAIAEAVAVVGLTSAIAERGGLDLRLSNGAPELSGGQRRRLMLAAAILRAPDLLVLDGTLEALGTQSVAQLLDLLRARGIAVLLAGHRADITALCDATVEIGTGS